MLVALLSTYREGPLAHAAVLSAFTATDEVIVFEGPAGPRLPNEDDCPPTVIGSDHPAIYLQTGEWKTDAAKRTAMIEYCRRFRDRAPVWGVWIDGDEILMNGEYLQDHLSVLEWEDDPAHPFMGWPIKLVELDGGVTVCRGKVVRIDLIDSYSVSSSVFRNALGHLHGEGNVPLRLSDYWAPYLRALEELPESQREAARDRLIVPPPLPGEPVLVPRSALRHPARRGLRLHEQEAVEIAKAQDGAAFERFEGEDLRESRKAGTWRYPEDGEVEA